MARMIRGLTERANHGIRIRPFERKRMDKKHPFIDPTETLFLGGYIALLHVAAGLVLGVMPLLALRDAPPWLLPYTIIFGMALGLPFAFQVWRIIRPEQDWSPIHGCICGTFVALLTLIFGRCVCAGLDAMASADHVYRYAYFHGLAITGALPLYGKSLQIIGKRLFSRA